MSDWLGWFARKRAEREAWRSWAGPWVGGTPVIPPLSELRRMVDEDLAAAESEAGSYWQGDCPAPPPCERTRPLLLDGDELARVRREAQAEQGARRLWWEARRSGDLAGVERAAEAALGSEPGTREAGPYGRLDSGRRKAARDRQREERLREWTLALWAVGAVEVVLLAWIFAWAWSLPVR